MQREAEGEVEGEIGSSRTLLELLVLVVETTVSFNTF